MKKIIFILTILLGSVVSYAQSYELKGDTICVIQQNDKPVQTSYIYKDSKGRLYPVYKSTNGKYFIYKLRKRDYQPYRYYLKNTDILK